MPAGLVARKWFLKHGVPYTVVLHGSDVPGYQPNRFKLIHIPMQIVARMVWNKAKSIVAVGQPLKQLAHKDSDYINTRFPDARRCTIHRPVWIHAAQNLLDSRKSDVEI